MHSRTTAHSQPRPNRRYRRLMPAALAAAALAASGSLLTGPPAHAARPHPPRAAAADKRPAVVPRSAVRDPTRAPATTTTGR